MSPTFRLVRKIDAVEIGPEGIVISDDKPLDYPYLSVKSQVAAYATAFKDRYRPPLDIYMIVKNRDKGNIIWEDIFSQDWFDFTLEKINRIPFKKRYFYKLRFQGQWYACKTCHMIWSDKGIKKYLKTLENY